MKRLLPPTLAWLLLVVAVPLGLYAPIVGPAAWPWRAAGLVPLFGGLALARAGHRLFERTGTAIGTFDQATLLVTSGPFAYTRNPMYLGITLSLAGAAVIVGSVTAWLAPVVFTAVATVWYIPLEERMMWATFGSAYAEYVDRVPRWLGRVGQARQLHHERHRPAH